MSVLTQEAVQLLANDALLSSVCLTDSQLFRHQAHRRKLFEFLLDRPVSLWLQRWFGQQLYFHHLALVDGARHYGVSPKQWGLDNEQWQQIYQQQKLLTLRIVLADGEFGLPNQPRLPARAGQYWLLNGCADWQNETGRYFDIKLATAPSVLDGLIAIEGLPTPKDLPYLSAPMLYRHAWSAWQAASPD